MYFIIKYLDCYEPNSLVQKQSKLEWQIIYSKLNRFKIREDIQSYTLSLYKRLQALKCKKPHISEAFFF